MRRDLLCQQESKRKTTIERNFIFDKLEETFVFHKL